VFSISASDPRPIYMQIMDEVRRAIAVGTLGSDEPLPSVRQLAGELRVNPNTVQQAYRELERTGAVYVRRGQGTYVSNSGNAERERLLLVRQVAARALRDAHRHGCTVEELIATLRSEAALPTTVGAEADAAALERTETTGVEAHAAAADGAEVDVGETASTGVEAHAAAADGAEVDVGEADGAEEGGAEADGAEADGAEADEPSGKAEAR
jgi:GntR family transcriptional regulator